LEVNPQEHLPIETTENTQIEAVLEVLLEKDHQEKRHNVLIRDIQQESLKETPQNFHGIQEKAPKITKKTGEAQTILQEPRRIIYTYQERFIQGLASARSSFPLTISYHEALKIVLWKS
jgi:hypothetical protein